MADSRIFWRRRQSATWRARGFETLDARLLLAADACRDDDKIVDRAAEVAAFLGETFHAADAGSTMGTAYELGELGATRSLPGTVGGFDTRDVLHFSLSAESNVNLELGGMQADIDLYLFDGSGRLLASSRRFAKLSESITGTLAAGEYYILIAPWGRDFSSYTLTVAASAIAPVPTSPPPPTTDPPPTADPPPSDPPVTDPSEPVAALPDVAYYGGLNEWNLNAVNAPEAWAAHYTGEGVIVAVIDTGVDVNHPDLMSQLWVNAGEIADNGLDDDGNGYVDDVSGWDFASGDNNPDDGHGHGTHVAGTIAADKDGSGATGVAPDATIMPVRVLDSNGSGTATGVAAGIRYAVDMGADIINLSLGGSYSSLIYAAIEYAVSHNVLVVAAAGNESASVPGYPARFAATLSGVLSVGAYSSSGAIASFSNDVGTSGAVQVDAPGVSIYSTYTDGRYARMSGTSMAAPHVAGLAALALSANPNLSAAELRNVIVAGADRALSGSDAVGGVNASLTVALAAAGQTSASTSSGTAAPQATSQVATARRFMSSSIAVTTHLTTTPGDSESTTSDFSTSLPAVTAEPTLRALEAAFAGILMDEDAGMGSLTDLLHEDQAEPWNESGELMLPLV